jgi:hypothetical protein
MWDEVNEITVNAIMLILTAKRVSPTFYIEICGKVPLSVLIIVKFGIPREAVIEHEIDFVEHIEIAPVDSSLITDVVILGCRFGST